MTKSTNEIWLEWWDELIKGKSSKKALLFAIISISSFHIGGALR